MAGVRVVPADALSVDAVLAQLVRLAFELRPRLVREGETGDVGDGMLRLQRTVNDHDGARPVGVLFHITEQQPALLDGGVGGDVADDLPVKALRENDVAVGCSPPAPRRVQPARHPPRPGRPSEGCGFWHVLASSAHLQRVASRRAENPCDTRLSGLTGGLRRARPASTRTRSTPAGTGKEPPAGPTSTRA